MKKNRPGHDSLMTPDEVAMVLRVETETLSKYDEQLKPLWINSRLRRYLRSRVEAFPESKPFCAAVIREASDEPSLKSPAAGNPR
jgi:hypothetical protein